jgi:hypothetical protein
MEPIAPGGCYPSDHPTPPGCWPSHPLPPEPDPGTLDASVDWLTYSHDELYQMVHNGLDLTGAMAVSAQWARLGDELGDIGDELAKIVEAAATAWQGEAADLARDTLTALTHWAADAGTLATKVSGCVSIEVDNATNARDNMPTPPRRLEPHPMIVGDFTGAEHLVADPDGPAHAENALHAQAARAMERFQQSSREVYATVPQFSPPQVGQHLLAGPVDPPPAPPQQPAPIPVPPRTTPRGPAAAPPRGPAAGPPRPEVPGRPAAPRPGAAVEPAAPATRPAAAASAPQQQERSGRPGVGGVPMGAGGRGSEDTERKSSAYLKEDPDIWGLDDQALAPPVIGESGRRA